MTPAPSPTRRSSFRAFRRRLAAGIAGAAALSMIPADMANAQVAAKMKDFFNDAGGAYNVTGPTAYQGQTAGYYSGGNVWSRFPQKSVQPFNLQLPSARAGCGQAPPVLRCAAFCLYGQRQVVMTLAQPLRWLPKPP